MTKTSRIRADLDGQGTPTSKVLSVPEAAQVLGISRAFAYELVARGELPHVRLGRRIVVPVRVVERMLARADAQLDGGPE